MIVWQDPCSKKEEYDPLLKTIIEDVDYIYPDLRTPEKTNAVRLLLVDHVTKEDDVRKRDDDGIDQGGGHTYKGGRGWGAEVIVTYI